jgi:hypothetical protein
MSSPPNRSEKIARVIWWALLALVLIVTMGVRVRLLGLPLERDEGEYAYAGQLMLDGIPPYQLAYNMKFPGTYAAYALFMSIFGQTASGVHLGLLVVNAATVALIFFLGRRLSNEVGGIAAVSCYAILSLSQSVLGFAGHATHFVVLPVVAGALLLLAALDRQSNARLFASGILFGLAVVMKQPGAFFVLFAFFYLIFAARKMQNTWRVIAIRAGSFLAGAVLPLVVTCLALWWSGVFGKFWFWSIQYAREYGNRVSWSLGAEVFATNILPVIGACWIIWLLAAIGLFGLRWFVKNGTTRLFLVTLSIFSAMAVSAGLYFRPHYFILVLPALSLLVGAVAAQCRSIRFRALEFVFPALLAAALALPLLAERDFYFWRPLGAASRIANGANPFPESVRIAEFLRERTTPGDTIVVLGSEPQIYFYAHRRSATGYIYVYSLMEPHRFAERMQEEMIREVEAARPKFVVFVGIDTSWLIQPESNRKVFDWFAQYAERELKPAGLVNIVSGSRTDYYLPYSSQEVAPSPYRITIYERKS